MINAGLNVCPFMMQIEDHNFTIIATEVSYVKPFHVGSLLLMSGERYDFVVEANQHEFRDFWIRFRQLNPCNKQLEGFAIMRIHRNSVKGNHETVEFNHRHPPSFEHEYPNGTVRDSKLLNLLLNQILYQLLNSLQPRKTDVPITHLIDFRVDDEITKGEADQTNYVFFDTPAVPNSEVYNDKMLRRYMCKIIRFHSSQSSLICVFSYNK